MNNIQHPEPSYFSKQIDHFDYMVREHIFLLVFIGVLGGFVSDYGYLNSPYFSAVNSSNSQECMQAFLLFCLIFFIGATVTVLCTSLVAMHFNRDYCEEANLEDEIKIFSAQKSHQYSRQGSSSAHPYETQYLKNNYSPSPQVGGKIDGPPGQVINSQVTDALQIRSVSPEMNGPEDEKLESNSSGHLVEVASSDESHPKLQSSQASSGFSSLDRRVAEMNVVHDKVKQSALNLKQLIGIDETTEDQNTLSKF